MWLTCKVIQGCITIEVSIFFALEKIQINYKNKRNLKGIMTLSVNLNQLIST